MVAYVVDEPSELSIVVLSVWENEPSTFVVVDDYDVVVLPSWLSTVVSVIVVIEPSSPTIVLVVEFAMYSTCTSLVATYPL